MQMGGVAVADYTIRLLVQLIVDPYARSVQIKRALKTIAFDTIQMRMLLTVRRECLLHSSCEFMGIQTIAKQSRFALAIHRA